MGVDPLLIECALAVIGIEPILQGTPRWNLELARRAEAMPRAARRMISGFLVQAEPEKAADLPPFDYDEARKSLVASDAVHAEALLMALPPELGEPVLEEASRVVGLLAQALPRRVRDSLVGTEVLPPTAQEQARYRRMWEIGNDPMIALRDMREGALCVDQAQALADLWPALTKSFRASVTDAIVGLRAARPTWTPTRAVEQQLLTLKGRPRTDSDILKAVQDSYAMQPQQMQPARAGGAKKIQLGADELATAGQVAENPQPR